MNNRPAQKGQGLVEFAIVFVVFSFMIMGLIDLSRAMMNYSILNNAVREGTRYAVVQPNGGNCAAITAIIESYYFNANGLENATIQCGPLDDPTIRIKITYNFVPTTPGVQLFLGDEITIEVQSEMYKTPNAQ
jgi:Flp pilus assembly protein TadG